MGLCYITSDCNSPKHWNSILFTAFSCVSLLRENEHGAGTYLLSCTFLSLCGRVSTPKGGDKVGEVKRAAIYCRVSSDRQAEEGVSLEAQQEECTRYIKDRGWELFDVFVDGGFSGGLPYQKRPALNALIQAVKKEQVDIIVVIKLDRLFRSTRGFYDALQILEEHHCGWVCVREPEMDTATAAGEMMLGVMMAMAQYERRQGSERVKIAHEEVVRRGGVISGSTPYGYKIEEVDGMKKLVPVPEEIAVIKDALEYYIETGSLQGTRVYIADKYDKHWTWQAFNRVIHNDVYLGKYRGNDNYCEPTIDKALLEKARAIETNFSGSHWNKKNIYIFARLLRCPGCGRIMQGTSDKTKAGVKRYFMRCQHVYTRKTCDFHKSISERKLEVQVVQAFTEYLEAEKLSLKTAEKEERGIDYEKQKKALETKLSRLTDIYVDGTIDKETYTKRYEPLKKELLALRPPKHRKHIDTTAWDGKDFADFYYALSREDKQKFWQQTLSEIIVNKDKELVELVL